MFIVRVNGPRAAIDCGKRRIHCPGVVTVYDLKPAFQRRLRPWAAALVRAGVRPNAVTIAALLGSAALGAAMWVYPGRLVLVFLPVWLFVRMALNAIDGLMAREHGLATRLGAVLNEAGDILADAALYLPLLRVCPPAKAALTGFAAGAVATELAGLLGPLRGRPRAYDGPMGKSDRALAAGAAALFGAVFPATLEAWEWIFWGGTVLCAWTAANRLVRVLGPSNPDFS